VVPQQNEDTSPHPIVQGVVSNSICDKLVKLKQKEYCCEVEGKNVLSQSGYISGIAKRSNLDDWSQYAKGNSFDQRQSKGQSRRDLEGVKGSHKAEVDWIPNDKDWQQDTRDDSRARYWSRKLGTGSNKG
jgi:hypothetical protein